jgi:predicted SAM-dependent methyltransferase
MIKYYAVAAMLKMFSTCSPMETFYRSLGNRLGSKKRIEKGIPKYYIENVNWILDICKKHNVIKNGDKLIELGTGWVHWQAITTKLFFDIEATLFDIWDNRQFDALKKYLSEYSEYLDRELDIKPNQKEHAMNLLKTILSVNSFSDLYNLLKFNYVIESSGNINKLEKESFNVVTSLSVLEHINKNILSEYMKDLYRILKPGGYSIHKISLYDHIYNYDKSVSPKYYLRFSDNVWRYCFENKVQYFNRVHKSEWLSLFKSTGFDLIDEKSLYIDVSNIKVNKYYKNHHKKDLSCVSMNIIHKKPITKEI